MTDLQKYCTNKFLEFSDLVDLRISTQTKVGVGAMFTRYLSGVRYVFIKPHDWIPGASIAGYTLRARYACGKLSVRP